MQETPPCSAILNGRADVEIALLDALRARVPQDAICITEAAGDARDAALRAPGGILWVIGGDGTINEAVQGLMERPPDDRPALGVVPAGTANDYARALGLLQVAPEVIVEEGHAWPATSVDTVGWGSLTAVNQITIGLPAQITDETPQEIKDALGGLAYAVHAMNELDSLSPFEARVCGADVDYSGPALMLGFAVGPFGGGGIPVHPDADLTSGEVHLVVVTAEDSPRMLRGRAARFALELAEGTPVNLDGEPTDDIPDEVLVQAQSLRVLAPPTTDSPFSRRALP